MIKTTDSQLWFSDGASPRQQSSAHAMLDNLGIFRLREDPCIPPIKKGRRARWSGRRCAEAWKLTSSRFISQLFDRSQAEGTSSYRKPCFSSWKAGVAFCEHLAPSITSAWIVLCFLSRLCQDVEEKWSLSADLLNTLWAKRKLGQPTSWPTSRLNFPL